MADIKRGDRVTSRKRGNSFNGTATVLCKHPKHAFFAIELPPEASCYHDSFHPKRLDGTAAEKCWEVCPYDVDLEDPNE